MSKELKDGNQARVNGYGDLAMDAEVRHLIGEVVTVVKQNRDGLFMVSSIDRRTYNIPKRNLDLV